MTLKRNNGGYTLAETIVCFALLGIFVVAAAVLIESSTEVYYNTKSDSGGHETVQTLLKDVRGELEDALPSVMYSVAMRDGECMWLRRAGSWCRCWARRQRRKRRWWSSGYCPCGTCAGCR